MSLLNQLHNQSNNLVVKAALVQASCSFVASIAASEWLVWLVSPIRNWLELGENKPRPKFCFSELSKRSCSHKPPRHLSLLL